ncbi:MAG: CDP-alcohol phosphatidyltransferase family protein [Acidobacteria bacterium]|nr:CDP-alcohol phosphatidyltransferase family protein [Acidobacteriota bacterium]
MGDAATLALKHEDIEERIDLVFYRPLGAALTQWLVPTAVTPNQVTFASAVVGGLGGVLFAFDSLPVNVGGMLAFVVANLLDSVDGQLARSKKMTSRLGRVLDGVAGAAIFGSIYLSLAIRLSRRDGWLALALGAAALLSQAVQNQMADYFRNAYLSCALPSSNGEMDSNADAGRLHAKAGNGAWYRRLLFRVYADYVWRQEFLAPRTARLYHRLSALGPERRTEAAAEYRALARPLLPYLAWLATNLRMLVLFAMLFAGLPGWFFPFNLVPLNIALVALVALHERNSQRVLRRLGGTR